MRSPKPFANIITGVRILCSIALLLCPAFSPSFYILYLAAGLTDMIDGPMARKTGTVSELGAKLDTAADFVFVAVCLWKLLPSLVVPLWLWVWIVLIALIKIINIISGYVIQKKYVANHTVMNKVTGVLLFLLPLTLPVVELKYSAPLVCTVATFAAIQEGHFMRTGREKHNFEPAVAQFKLCFPGNHTILTVPESPMFNAPEAAIVTEPRLALVRQAGKQYAKSGEIDAALLDEIRSPMIPEEQYAAIVNGGK